MEVSSSNPVLLQRSSNAVFVNHSVQLWTPSRPFIPQEQSLSKAPETFYFLIPVPYDFLSFLNLFKRIKNGNQELDEIPARPCCSTICNSHGWKQPPGPSLEGRKKTCCIYMQCNMIWGIVQYVTTQRKPEDMMPNEISQAQRSRYCRFPSTQST